MNKFDGDIHINANDISTQLTREIAARQLAEEKVDGLNHELVNLQRHLITASHQASMAEIATSVMHNIGNVLNSAEVSIYVLKNKMSHGVYKKISSVAAMLTEHESNLIDYFQNNEQGKLLLHYLPVLLKETLNQKNLMDNEIIHLQHQYDVIKKIISAENEACKHSTAMEKIWVPELIDSSIGIILTEDSMLAKNITLNKNYNYASYIVSNKIHLMQVLINVLKNAKESIMEMKEAQQRTINISTELFQNTKQIEIRITDNGIGISPENVSKIFTFGFSTKHKGHGFGLHNAAIIVKQLGGLLTVESEGLDRGATFILRLPLLSNSLIA